VLSHIRGLHTDFANTQAHSQWLQRFQQAPEAWGVVHELLTENNEEVVHHFAAHTLVTKLQAGDMPSQGSITQDLMGYLSNFWRGPASVRRQIVVAMIDSILWQEPDKDSPWLMSCLSKFTESMQALPCLLELLHAIPEESMNKKVVVPPARRSTFAVNMLQHTGSVFEALSKASQANEMCAYEALRAFARWLQLQQADPTLRAQKKTSAKVGGYSADVVARRVVHEHPLFQKASQIIANVKSSNIEMLRASADVMSEAHLLSTETSPQARAMLLVIVQAIVAASTQLWPELSQYTEKFMDPDCELATRAAIIGRLVSELGPAFHRIRIADGAEAVYTAQFPPTSPTEAMGALIEVALLFVTLRHISLSKCGVDFWYAVLGQHQGAAAEEDDPWQDSSQLSSDRRGFDPWGSDRDLEADLARRKAECQLLEDCIMKMVQASWKAVRYPAEPDQEEYLDWDEFVRYREVCSMNITEACIVVTPRKIIELIGEMLERICAQSPMAWQDLDACIFVLTGVASKAPAGQDTVIPRLIDLLPEFPYHTQGFKALLFRNSASRLVLFTSGYLALHPEPMKKILKFLTSNHLPAIPSLPVVPEKEAMKYSQALACDALKMVLTSARKIIVTADNGTMWPEVVTAVIPLVQDDRLFVDSKAQLIFGIGHILSMLEDWEKLEHMLDMFVSRMEQAVLPLLASLPPEPLGSRAQKTTSDKKAPPVLKLYIASVSSVYSMPPRDPTLPPADHHPVLAVVEKHFSIIEKVCLHHTQYDDLMEQLNMAVCYILGFAREYVPKSSIFVPLVRLLARCCEQHPQPFYMGLIKQCIGFFAPANAEDMNYMLVELTGLYIVPVVRHLNSANAVSAPIAGASYEMLAEAFRHYCLSLLAIRNSTWFADVLDATVTVLPRLCEESQAVYEKAITAAMRFLRNVLMWGDPQTSSNNPMPEFQELQQVAQAVIGETQLPNGVCLPRLVKAMIQILVATASNGILKSDVIPTLAEVLRTLLQGPFAFKAGQLLEEGLRSLPSPLSSIMRPSDIQSLLQSLRVDMSDAHRFTLAVLGVAEQFAVTLKRAQFSG